MTRKMPLRTRVKVAPAYLLKHLAAVAGMAIILISLTSVRSRVLALAGNNIVPSPAVSIIPSTGDQDLDHIILNAGSEYGVDPRLIYQVINKESGFNPNARSSRHALGLMQIIPATAQRFDVRDPFDPEDNVNGGVRYIRWLLERYDGDVRLTLAAYNAGEGRVRRNGNQVPNIRETIDYVESIVEAYGTDYHPVLDPEQARIVFGLPAPPSA